MMTLKKARRNRRREQTRSPLMWPRVTPKNRRQLIARFAEEWKLRNTNAGNPDNLSEIEIAAISAQIGKLELGKIVKGTKAYNKGKSKFTYHGKVYEVETAEVLKNRIEMQTMIKEMQAKKAQEEEE